MYNLWWPVIICVWFLLVTFTDLVIECVDWWSSGQALVEVTRSKLKDNWTRKSWCPRITRRIWWVSIEDDNDVYHCCIDAWGISSNYEIAGKSFIPCTCHSCCLQTFDKSWVLVSFYELSSCPIPCIRTPGLHLRPGVYLRSGFNMDSLVPRLHPLFWVD